MENTASKEKFIPRMWNGGTGRRVALIVCSIVIAAVAVFGLYQFIKLFDVGENVLIGGWQYTKKITIAGDLDFSFYFATDGRLSMSSEYGTNTGTYSLVKGGNEGAFITNFVGEEIMYDYMLEGDVLTITTLDGVSKVLNRIT